MGTSQPRDRIQVSHIAGGFFTSWARSPRILEWVAYPFSSGFSQPRNRTGVFCIAGRFFTNWAIGEWEGQAPGSWSEIRRILIKCCWVNCNIALPSVLSQNLLKCMQLSSAFGIWVLLHGLVCAIWEMGRIQESAEMTPAELWACVQTLPTQRRSPSLTLARTRAAQWLDTWVTDKLRK